MILNTQPKLGAHPPLGTKYFMYLKHLAHGSTGDGGCRCCAYHLLSGGFLLWLWYISDVKKIERESWWVIKCAFSFLT